MSNKPSIFLYLALACLPMPAAPAQTDTAAPTALAAATQPTDSTTSPSGLVFTSRLVTEPDGRTVGKVYVTDPDKGLLPKRVVEIPADVLPGWPKERRAQTVADRLNKAYGTNPKFYEGLVDTTLNDEVVLSYSTTGDFIITADRKSAQMNNYPPTATHDYAQNLIDQLRKMLSDPSVRDAKFDYQLTTPEEKRDRAVMYRNEGDDAFTKGALDKAEARYNRALTLVPDYDYCRLQLAGVYIQEGKKDAARTVLNAVNKPALNPDDVTAWNNLDAKL
jgi:hypothetical protein